MWSSTESLIVSPLLGMNFHTFAITYQVRCDETFHQGIEQGRKML